MLQELQTKSGIDGIYDENGKESATQTSLGKRILRDFGTKSYFDKTGDGMYQINKDMSDYISENGYLPQKLITKALAAIYRSEKGSHPSYEYMWKDRKKFVIDKRLGDVAEELFQQVIRPRQTLIDSEQLAIQQLKLQSGYDVNSKLMQLPLDDKQATRTFNYMNNAVMVNPIVPPGGGGGGGNGGGGGGPNGRIPVPINNRYNYNPYIGLVRIPNHLIPPGNPIGGGGDDGSGGNDGGGGGNDGGGGGGPPGGNQLNPRIGGNRIPQLGGYDDDIPSVSNSELDRLNNNPPGGGGGGGGGYPFQDPPGGGGGMGGGNNNDGGFPFGGGNAARDPLLGNIGIPGFNPMRNPWNKYIPPRNILNPPRGGGNGGMNDQASNGGNNGNGGGDDNLGGDDQNDGQGGAGAIRQNDQPRQQNPPRSLANPLSDHNASVINAVLSSRTQSYNPNQPRQRARSQDQPQKDSVSSNASTVLLPKDNVIPQDDGGGAIADASTNIIPSVAPIRGLDPNRQRLNIPNADPQRLPRYNPGRSNNRRDREEEKGYIGGGGGGNQVEERKSEDSQNDGQDQNQGGNRIPSRNQLIDDIRQRFNSFVIRVPEQYGVPLMDLYNNITDVLRNALRRNAGQADLQDGVRMIQRILEDPRLNPLDDEADRKALQELLEDLLSAYRVSKGKLGELLTARNRKLLNKKLKEFLQRIGQGIGQIGRGVGQGLQYAGQGALNQVQDPNSILRRGLQIGANVVSYMLWIPMSIIQRTMTAIGGILQYIGQVVLPASAVGLAWALGGIREGIQYAYGYLASRNTRQAFIAGLLIGMRMIRATFSILYNIAQVATSLIGGFMLLAARQIQNIAISNQQMRDRRLAHFGNVRDRIQALQNILQEGEPLPENENNRVPVQNINILPQQQQQQQQIEEEEKQPLNQIPAGGGGGGGAKKRNKKEYKQNDELKQRLAQRRDATKQKAAEEAKKLMKEQEEMHRQAQQAYRQREAAHRKYLRNRRKMRNQLDQVRPQVQNNPQAQQELDQLEQQIEQLDQEEQKAIEESLRQQEEQNEVQRRVEEILRQMGLPSNGPRIIGADQSLQQLREELKQQQEDVEEEKQQQQMANLVIPNEEQAIQQERADARRLGQVYLQNQPQQVQQYVYAGAGGGVRIRR